MFKFKRDSQHVILEVRLEVPNYEARTFPFKWDCGRKIYAGLLSAEFQKQLREAVRVIRKEAYLDGWKDAKAKRRKKTFFSSNIF